MIGVVSFVVRLAPFFIGGLSGMGLAVLMVLLIQFPYEWPIMIDSGHALGLFLIGLIWAALGGFIWNRGLRRGPPKMWDWDGDAHMTDLPKD